MGLTDSDADVDRVINDEVVVPSAHASYSPPFLCSSGTHDYPDSALLDFMIPEYDDPKPEPDAGMILGHAHVSPNRGLDFDLTFLSTGAPGRERWVNWHAGHSLSCTNVSTGTGAGKYAGDGMIGLFVFGRGGISPSNIDDYSCSPAGRRAELEHVMDEGYRTGEVGEEEEEEVMGLSFAANTSDEDFVLPLGLGKDARRPGPDQHVGGRAGCKLYCDSCIEKWNTYPDTTFDLFADTFACPVFSGYCNCSLCAPKRREKYVLECNGGLRSWIAQQGGGPDHLATVPPARAHATKTKSQSKARVKVAPAPSFDLSRSSTAVFTVSDEPLGNAFLQGKTAHTVTISQPTVPPPPPAMPPPPTRHEPTQKEEQLQKKRHVFVGKLLKEWGHIVALPDPNLDQPEQKKPTKGRNSAGALRRFDANCKNLGDDGDEDGNSDQAGGLDIKADADSDADDGVWPGEFVVPTVVVKEPEAELEMVETRATLEDVERATGAAFATGAAAGYLSSSSGSENKKNG
ncbi:hypothetical protein V8E53_005820 [Lactarius tabidus]